MWRRGSTRAKGKREDEVHATALWARRGQRHGLPGKPEASLALGASHVCSSASFPFATRDFCVLQNTLPHKQPFLAPSFYVWLLHWVHWLFPRLGQFNPLPSQQVSIKHLLGDLGKFTSRHPACHCLWASFSHLSSTSLEQQLCPLFLEQSWGLEEGGPSSFCSKKSYQEICNTGASLWVVQYLLRGQHFHSLFTFSHEKKISILAHLLRRFPKAYVREDPELRYLYLHHFW